MEENGRQSARAFDEGERRVEQKKTKNVLWLESREEIEPLLLVSGAEESRISCFTLGQKRVGGSGHGLWEGGRSEGQLERCGEREQSEEPGNAR